MNALFLYLILVVFSTYSTSFTSQTQNVCQSQNPPLEKKNHAPNLKAKRDVEQCYTEAQQEIKIPLWNRALHALQHSPVVAQLSSPLSNALWYYDHATLPEYLEQLEEKNATAPGNFITQALQEALDLKDPKKVITMVTIIQNPSLKLADKVPQANQQAAYNFLQQQNLNLQICLCKFPRRLPVGDGRLTPRSKSQKDALRAMLQQRYPNIDDDELAEKTKQMFEQLITREPKKDK